MKLSLFKSLQFRLPFLVLLGVIPTTAIAISIAGGRAGEILQEEARELIALKANALDANISRWTDMNVMALQNLSKQPAVKTMDPAQQKPVLMQMHTHFKPRCLSSSTWATFSGHDFALVVRTILSSKHVTRLIRSGLNLVQWSRLAGIRATAVR